MDAVLAIFVLGAVIFFGALISAGNERQRKALDGIREQTALWAMQDLRLKREKLARWSQAITETAIVFWIAQFVISAPAQVLAWGAFDFREPRVASALWILVLTALVYIVARWIGEKNWMSLAAIANLAIFLIVLRGAVNILHPGNAIIASDSLAIKAFYAAIVLTMGLLAVQFARDRANG